MTIPSSFDTPPGLDHLADLAAEAFAELPEAFRAMTGNVSIRVEDFPDEETERLMALESPFDLLGLYHGVALTEKSLADPSPNADMIFLYRRPLLDYWCETGENLKHLVRHVLVHEIGHHFGLSDDDMDRIEDSV